MHYGSKQTDHLTVTKQTYLFMIISRISTVD